MSQDASIVIREVWNSNLEEEMKLINEAIDDYPYAAMDTEYPGVVFSGPTSNTQQYNINYITVKQNVNELKLIQLGLALSDENGNLPTCGTNKHCVWQFNFKEFDIDSDPHNGDSIQLLIDSGLDLEKNKNFGIQAERFADLVMSSRLVRNKDIQWITFQGSYDLGYLLKVLTQKSLPEAESDFFVLVDNYFPILYDTKHVMGSCGYKGSLRNVADRLGVERVGTSHQAGSDSLLTCCVFQKLKKVHFNDIIENRHIGCLFGLDHHCRVRKTE